MLKPLLLVLLVFAQATDTSLELPRSAEFPPSDERIWMLQSAGLRAKVAARRIALAPDRADTLDLFLQLDRIDDALRVLRRIVDTRPDEMAAAFKAIAGGSHRILGGAPRGYPDALREIVAAAETRLDGMPRQQAARTARQLLSVDNALSRTRQGPNQWPTQLAAFVSRYSDTEEGLLAQVDLITNRLSPQVLEQLEAFIQAHPGTTAAARALHAKGFHLGVNFQSLGEKTGSDPTERFFRVLNIATELESGKYPASQSVSDAPRLVLQFSSYKPVYAPGNVDRVLTAQEEFVQAHLRLDPRDPLSDSVRYFITNRMADLFKLKGDAVGGVEGVLSRLEQSSGHRDAVRYLRAQFYLRPPEALSDDQPHALREKAQQTLESLYASSTGFYQRKALATLATLHFEERHDGEARTLYRKYVEAYPDSDYAWVAALRIGQCEELLNNPKGAADVFRGAAARHGANPLARVLGHAYAARAAEGASDFRQALADYQAALAAWDDDYGQKYSLYSTRPVSPNEPFMFVDELEVAKQALPDRISQLQRATSAAGGTVLERGRWLLARERWDEAIAALSALLRPSVKSPFVAEARYLSHRARLERALAAADAANPDSEHAKAVHELEALSREPFDFAVGAAKIALASLVAVQRAPGDPGRVMLEALTAWHAADRQQPPSAPRGALERDIVDIRNAVFLPKGGGVYENARWNAFSWSGRSARFLVVDPDLQVTLPDGNVIRVSAYDPFPEFDNVVFLPDERRTVLERIMTRVGGTKKRRPRAVMETPNQPIGPSLDVLAFWKKFFAAQPGHWGGWVFETYPIINQIEFINAERTRAAVKVTVGYSGATVQLEKKDGVWMAKELTNFWIT